MTPLAGGPTEPLASSAPPCVEPDVLCEAVGLRLPLVFVAPLYSVTPTPTRDMPVRVSSAVHTAPGEVRWARPSLPSLGRKLKPAT